MKIMIGIFAMFLTGNTVWAQVPPDDWSWTFLRGEIICGLLFEDVNLSASVKGAIRDDVSWSYSFVATSNLFTRLYISGDTEYGTFIGSDGTKGNNGGAEGLRSWRYKLHNGNRYFHVDKKLSARYLEKIALTNQHQVAAGSLSNFLTTVNNVTTNNAVMAEYITYWWLSGRNRMPTVDDFSNPGDFMEFIMPYCEEELLAPSILNFRYGERELNGELCYKVVFRNRLDGSYKHSVYDLVFKNGQWRIVLPFY